MNLRLLKLYSKLEMSKTIIVTGSTDGIGKLAAIKLAKDGCTIGIHGRNPQKVKDVVEEIKNTTNNDSIKGFVADFSDLEAVKQMIQEVKNEFSKLDVLINNAGILKSPVTLNKDGLDIRMVVNYLASYVLTEGLLPLLKKGKKSRLINLSSAAQASVSHDLLIGRVQRPDMEAYSQSKLAIAMWSMYLAQQLDNITVIPVNPGSLLNTNMVREGFGRFWSSADKGGKILYDLAVGERYEGITGQYFDNDKGDFGKAHPDAYNPVKIEQLINMTNDLLNS